MEEVSLRAASQPFERAGMGSLLKAPIAQRRPLLSDERSYRGEARGKSTGEHPERQQSRPRRRRRLYQFWRIKDLVFVMFAISYPPSSGGKGGTELN